MKIETFLPAFSGTYGTYWEFDNDYIALVDNDLPCGENDVIHNYEVDHKKYLTGICKFICGYLETELKGFVRSIELQDVGSPREYNFSNDWANVEIDVKAKEVRDYIYENKETFTQYLKDNFTSYEGFSSFFSNDFKVWETETNGFRDLKVDKQRLGSILQFICDQEEIDDETMVSKWLENDTYSSYIKEEQIS